MRISIDPGSGIRDDGVHSSGRLSEPDYSLTVCKRVCELVNREPGLISALTRWDEGIKSWRRRLEEVVQHRSEMCICLHIDCRDLRDYSSFTSYVSVMATGLNRRLQALLHNDVACQLRMEYGIVDGGKRNDTEHRDFGLPLLENSPCLAIHLEGLFICSNKNTILHSDAFREHLARIIATGIINQRGFLSEDR
ncbi:N-acetylmuramoyl-L-alanine amidase [Desmospora profundinema]|uniref:N-acetylmuramoyl-L-alanine amidase n=1 Tax=Desmospora profundinema TaxID=1571184 RepID=A0ABU1IMW9_9BACL|nr:N-acetylmuramoyl-L-alanine amidase [Desmospora profundinema]MDR6226056.1 N-acetylmuramoyl-L-alanine amidase [Desmospora profundinema]